MIKIATITNFTLYIISQRLRLAVVWTSVMWVTVCYCFYKQNKRVDNRNSENEVCYIRHRFFRYRYFRMNLCALPILVWLSSALLANVHVRAEYTVEAYRHFFPTRFKSSYTKLPCIWSSIKNLVMCSQIYLGSSATNN